MAKQSTTNSRAAITIACQFWNDTCHPHGGLCRVINTKVSHGVCAACLRDGKEGKHLLRVQPLRGLGDAVAKVMSAIGIKPCDGCKKRQAALNRLAPFSQPQPQNFDNETSNR